MCDVVCCLFARCLLLMMRCMLRLVVGCGGGVGVCCCFCRCGVAVRCSLSVD